MGEGLRYLVKVFLVLNDMDPRAEKIRSRTTGLVVTALLVAALTTGWWGWGWVPSVATAAEVQKMAPLELVSRLAKRQDQLALVIVKGAIRDRLVDRCNASRRQNQQALDAANSSLDDLSDQFRALANRDPVIPSCDTILISPAPVQ